MVKDQKRQHEDDIPVGPRVRFAPSPTGPLHLGGARTALFNWLFAKKYQGTFILRVEDTDVERSNQKYERDIIDNLSWLGLDLDEGPEQGGPYAPYRQSERSKIYSAYLQQLLNAGRAYYCFCKEGDLEAERQEMLSRGVAPRYSGRCRTLSRREAENNLAKGVPSIIRFRMPEKVITFDDAIRGKVSFDAGLLGDTVIAKNLNSALFNFAVVVDDFAMKITHVIRGEDHLSNTPKQLALQEALGFSHPVYAHIPLILGPDRSKLSKRHGVFSVSEYRSRGYLPEAMINFLVLLGWHPPGDQEIFSRESLVQAFDMARIQKAGAVFNNARLNWFNSYYLKEKSDEELLELVKPYFEKAGYMEVRSGGVALPKEYLLKIVHLERHRLKTLDDIVDLAQFFFEEPSQYPPELLIWKKSTKEEAKAALAEVSEVLNKLPKEDFTAPILEKVLQPLYGSDKGKILWTLRVSLSGREASPGPFEIAEILGKDPVLKRLRHAQSLLSP